MAFLRWAVSELDSLSLASLRPRRSAFPNGMTYARLGDGPKTLLWLSGATKGPMLAMMTRAVRPFVADGYSVWLVSGRPIMPTGHTLLDMADDYATLSSCGDRSRSLTCAEVTTSWGSTSSQRSA